MSTGDVKLAIGSRKEIDGLRAVSVLAVIAGHFAIPGAAGGFTGVDVFFVISGYLITGILIDAMDAGTFSLVKFYDRRIRRILPALLVVIAATLVAGFVFLMPGDYARAAESSLWAAFFAPNIYFEDRTGYFDPTSALTPLLHLWSLGVEEQFYLVWPLLLLAAPKLRAQRGALIAATIALTLASFALSEFLLYDDPKAAFYLAPPRAWELGIGAVIALLPRDHGAFQSRILSEFAPALGLACILYGMWRLNPDALFPGHNALLPVIGAALIVAPWNARGLVFKTLSLPPFVFVGLISYSLYLCHWPILVMYRHYASLTEVAPHVSALLIALTFVAATLTWVFVEQPIRRAKPPAWVTFSAGAAAVAAVFAGALVIVSQNGLPARLPPSLAGITSLDEMWRYDCPQSAEFPAFGETGACVVGAPWESATSRAMIWGDSHAQSLLPLFATPAEEAGIALLLPLDSCVPFVSDTGIKRDYPGIPTYTAHCSMTRAQVLNLMARPDGPTHLIIAASWPFHLGDLYRNQDDARSPVRGLELMREGLDELAAELAAHGKHLTIISDIPPRPSEAVTCLVGGRGMLRAPCPEGATAAPRSYADSLSGATNALIREMPASWPNVSVVILPELMCDSEACLTSLNGEFLYRDSGHYRRNLWQPTRDQIAVRMGLRAVLEAGEARRD